MNPLHIIDTAQAFVIVAQWVATMGLGTAIIAAVIE